MWTLPLGRENLKRNAETAGFFPNDIGGGRGFRDSDGGWLEYRCNGHGHVWAEPVNSCHVRLCPFDMRERAARALHRFHSVVDGLKAGKYAVFAERNCPVGPLAAGIKSLFAAWNRLRKHPVWQQIGRAHV